MDMYGFQNQTKQKTPKQVILMSSHNVDSLLVFVECGEVRDGTKHTHFTCQLNLGVQKYPLRSG